VSGVGVDRDAVRRDFDDIAALARDGSDAGWDHNAHFHAFLLTRLPARGAHALDVGCGTGSFTRRLAARFDRVLALDLSPRMIDVARARSDGCRNITYEVADVLACDLPGGAFDAIATVATLHHLPIDPALRKLRDALAPGGTLLVLDLFRPVSPLDQAARAASYPYSLALRLRHGARLRPPAHARALWEAHGRRDVYPTLASVRAACAEWMPGARVRRHLLWRYSIVWRRPETGG
jgi:ubiquinone/menaquinone biosynthesis C-methylase UbiE